MTVVYRILTMDQWREALTQGAVRPNALDRASRFLHLSGEGRLLETATRYFAPEHATVALELDAEELGEALRWEPVATREGQRFPHLYAPEIAVGRVRAVIELAPSEDGAFSLGARTQQMPD